MSQFIKFHFASSMLNMFRTLIHPSSGACDFIIATRIPPQPTTPKLQHTSKQEQTTNVVIQQKKPQVPDDGCINVRNMLSIEEVK